jgi:hypothetical protein
MPGANAEAFRRKRPLFAQQQSPETECQRAKKGHGERYGHAILWRIAATKPASQQRCLINRGRGYQNLRYLLLKAKRLAVSNTEFIALTSVKKVA